MKGQNMSQKYRPFFLLIRGLLWEEEVNEEKRAVPDLFIPALSTMKVGALATPAGLPLLSSLRSEGDKDLNGGGE
ncbi:hypothetical protein J6590_074660 [Homalodisca vitripennis]|nr:hypothetical protein J6590_074660 [Homalodisca vitripennis]